MNKRATETERRKIRSVARDYERNGYEVRDPRHEGGLPAFLAPFMPDLIAESDHDRVVIEVKRVDQLRGSNALIDVADRVAREPGWRLELVALPAAHEGQAPPPKRMDAVAERARDTMRAGHLDLAYLYAWSVVEELLKDLGRRHGVDSGKASLSRVARALVFKGVVPAEILDAVGQASAVRNQMVHSASVARPPTKDVERLLTLGRLLRDELADPAAA